MLSENAIRVEKKNSGSPQGWMSVCVPVFGGEVVEVDELGRGPDEPLGQVQPPAQLQSLRGQTRGWLGLQRARHHQARCYTHRAEHQLK